MDKIFDLLGVWFCVIILVLVGCFVGVLFETSLIVSMSFLSNVATVLGFILALKAYKYWVRKDTISLQKQVLRDILMELMELEEELFDVFTQAILDEGQLKKVIFPTDEQRQLYGNVPSRVNNVKILFKKYYVLELKPSVTAYHMDKTSMTLCSFEGDIFGSLKDLFFKLKRLEVLLKNGHTLEFEGNKLKSSQPLEQGLYNDQSTSFYHQKSFNGIHVGITRHIREIERSILGQIS